MDNRDGQDILGLDSRNDEAYHSDSGAATSRSGNPRRGFRGFLKKASMQDQLLEK